MQFRFPSAIPGFDPISQGKTRDIFPAAAKSGPHAGQKLLLFLATDRISTHNVVHASTIPLKGYVLNALTVFWLSKLLRSVSIPSHLVAAGKRIYDYLPGKPSDYPDDLHYRAIVVRRLRVIPVEFIFRGYLSGSLYKSYYSKGISNPYGVALQSGLRLMDRFHLPLFTPTEKSETDDPLNAEAAKKQYPEAYEIARRTFLMTRHHLRGKGFELIDGKYEVGVDPDGHAVIVDEISTPDSSRFCRKSAIVLGKDPPWFDKQIARDEAERVWGSGPKIPLTFSPETVQQVSQTYRELFAVITGQKLDDFRQGSLDWSC